MNDGPVKSMFSRKDAENAKKISFNINKVNFASFAPLREILTFYEFINE